MLILFEPLKMLVLYCNACKTPETTKVILTRFCICSQTGSRRWHRPADAWCYQAPQTHRENADLRDVKQHYYRNLFLPFLDHMITEVKEQLIEPRPRLLAQYLISTVAWKCRRKRSLHCIRQRLCLRWKGGRTLETEVAGYTGEGKASHSMWYPVCYAEGVISIIYTALTILATMPVSAATAEWSFSLLKRLKTWLWNTMMQDPLTGLSLMNFHHEIPVDIDNVLRDFEPLNDCRILLAFLKPFIRYK